MMNRRELIISGIAGVGLMTVGRLSAYAQDLTEKAVFFDPDTPVLGNPKGSVTVVEYFDYQCPYCKKSHGMIDKVVKSDGDVRFILKDWPVFGPASVFAAQAVLGAAQIGKYEIAMAALMNNKKAKITEDDVERILNEAKVPMDEITVAVNKHAKKINGLLDRNYGQAVAFGFQGTPSFVIGRKTFAGVLDERGLRAAIKEARASKNSKT